MSGVFRRCGCRDENGRQYAVLGDDPTAEQRARACPVMVTDPKHGRWSFRISAGFDPMTGKRRQVNGKTYATKREAQRARNEAAVRVDRREYIAPTRTTLAEWLPTWLERRQRTGDGLKPTTVENYRRYIEQDIAPSQLGQLRLDDIRRHHIESFIDDLVVAGRGAVTVRRIIAVVQGSLRAAAKSGVISANPARDLGDALPAVDSRPFEPWQPAQVGHFLDIAAEHRLGPLFEVAVFTGMRRGELLGLRWADVDLGSGTILVRRNRTTAGVAAVEGTTKTQAGTRRLDVDARTVDALQAWKATQDADRAAWGAEYTPSGYVFTDAHGAPLKAQYATRLFDRLREQAALPRMTLHGLRHLNASLMLAAGTDLAIVSKRLGHSSVQVTGDVYAHLVGSASRDAANAAAALVPARKAPVHTVHAHRAGNASGARPALRQTGP